MSGSGPPYKPEDQARKRREQQREKKQLQDTLKAKPAKDRARKQREGQRGEKQPQDKSGAKRAKDQSPGQQQSGKARLDKHGQRDKGELSKGKQRLKLTLDARNASNEKERADQTRSPAAKEQKSYKDDLFMGVSDRLPQSRLDDQKEHTGRTQSPVAKEQKSYKDDLFMGVSDRLPQSRLDDQKERAGQTQSPAAKEQKSYKDDLFTGVSDRLPQSRLPDEGHSREQRGVVKVEEKELELRDKVKLRKDMTKVDFGQEQLRGIDRAVKLVRDNTQSYVLEVHDAIEDFEKYAEDKIEKLDGKISAGKLAADLADAILVVLAPEAKLATYVGSKIGKNLVKYIYGEMKDALKKEVEQETSKDAKELKRAVSTLRTRARDQASIIGKDVVEEIEIITGPIRTKIQRNEKLEPEEETFVAEVYAAPYDKQIRDDAPSIEAALTRRGVPTPEGVYAEVLRSLITEFEKRYFEATASQGEKFDMGYYEGKNWSRGAPGRAWAKWRGIAEAYVNQRLQEMKRMPIKDGE